QIARPGEVTDTLQRPAQMICAVPSAKHDADHIVPLIGTARFVSAWSRFDTAATRALSRLSRELRRLVRKCRVIGPNFKIRSLAIAAISRGLTFNARI